AKARLYGADKQALGGLRALYLLMDEPEVYGLPSEPKVPSASVQRSSFWSIFTGLLVALGVLFQFRERRKPVPAPAPAGDAPPNQPEAQTRVERAGEGRP